MRYQRGYKYKLKQSMRIEVPFAALYPEHTSKGHMINYRDNILWLSCGYAWDGASGLPDNKRTLVPSLWHDAWYQLIRAGRVPLSSRPFADEWFGDLTHERGTWRWVADSYVYILDQYGEKAATTEPLIFTEY